MIILDTDHLTVLKYARMAVSARACAAGTLVSCCWTQQRDLTPLFSSLCSCLVQPDGRWPIQRTAPEDIQDGDVDVVLGDRDR